MAAAIAVLIGVATSLWLSMLLRWASARGGRVRLRRLALGAGVPAGRGTASLRPWWLQACLRLPSWPGRASADRPDPYGLLLVRANLGGAMEAARLRAAEPTLALGAGCVAGAGAVLLPLPLPPAPAIALAAAGLVVPLLRRAVGRLADARQSRLRAELPACVNVLVLALESGLTVRQALAVAARHAPPAWRPVVERIVVQADQGLALDRAMEASLATIEPGPGRAVLRALSAGEQAGVSQVEVLRQQADYARSLAHRAWQERVDSLPVLLMLTGIFLLFPPVLIIVLLPNLLTFLTSSW